MDIKKGFSYVFRTALIPYEREMINNLEIVQILEDGGQKEHPLGLSLKISYIISRKFEKIFENCE